MTTLITVEGPINYVYTQIPEYDKLIHFFGDHHPMSTRCKGYSISINELIENTLKADEYKDDIIDVFVEVGYGSDYKNLFLNSYSHYLYRTLFEKGCLNVPRDIRCRINYPNCRFHSIDVRETFRNKVMDTIEYVCEKYGQANQRNIKQLQRLVWLEIRPYVEPVDEEVGRKEIDERFLVLNLLSHLLFNYHKDTFSLSNAVFESEFYMLLKDQDRFNQYFHYVDESFERRDIPQIPQDIQLFYPYYYLSKVLAKIQDEAIRSKLTLLTMSLFKKWGSITDYPDYRQYIKDQQYGINCYGLDEFSEMFDLYLVLRLFQGYKDGSPSPSRVICFMGADHIRGSLHLLNQLQTHVENKVITEKVEFPHEDFYQYVAHQCIQIPVTNGLYLPMRYKDNTVSTTPVKDITKDRYYSLPNERYNKETRRTEHTHFYKVGDKKVDIKTFKVYLQLPIELQLNILKQSFGSKEELIEYIMSLKND